MSEDRFKDDIKLYPEAFINEKYGESYSGLHYWDMELVHIDNFWPDKPVETKLTLHLDSAELLLKQLSLAIPLRRIMFQIEGLSLGGDYDKDFYDNLVYKARILTIQLAELNGGKIRSFEPKESDNDGDEEETNRSV